MVVFDWLIFWVCVCVVIGGVGIKVCIVKGVNFVMEYVDVCVYGWFLVIWLIK